MAHGENRFAGDDLFTGPNHDRDADARIDDVFQPCAPCAQRDGGAAD
jgi:hypothetical protein